MTEIEYIEEQLQAATEAIKEYERIFITRGMCLARLCVYAENLAAAIARADRDGIKIPLQLRFSSSVGIATFARASNLARYSRTLNDEWGTNPGVEVGPDSPHCKGPDAVGMMSPDEAIEWFDSKASVPERAELENYVAGELY